MRFTITGTKTTGWELVLDGNYEPLGVVENATFDEAIDAFAANWPEYSAELDEFKCEDFVGAEAGKPRRQHAGERKSRKRGSGARFRELILQGKSNEECVRTVRQEFPESTATLSDAAWQRAQLRKNPSAYAADGTKI